MERIILSVIGRLQCEQLGRVAYIKTSTNVPGRPEGSYLKFYKCLNYIFNNNTFSPI